MFSFRFSRVDEKIYTGCDGSKLTGNGTHLLCVQDGRILGSARISKSVKGDLWIDDVSVTPEWRGKGIGQTLVSRLLRLTDGNVFAYGWHMDGSKRGGMPKLLANVGFGLEVEAASRHMVRVDCNSGLPGCSCSASIYKRTGIGGVSLCIGDADYRLELYNVSGMLQAGVTLDFSHKDRTGLVMLKGLFGDAESVGSLIERICCVTDEKLGCRLAYPCNENSKYANVLSRAGFPVALEGAEVLVGNLMLCSMEYCTGRSDGCKCIMDIHIRG